MNKNKRKYSDNRHFKSKWTDSDSDDECQVVYDKLHPVKFQQRITKTAKTRRTLENYVMPNTSDTFVPPSIEQLQYFLTVLDLPLDLAHDTPLLKCQTLETKGKMVVTRNVDGDGNCGFRAISVLLTGKEDFHWEIRLAIYQYIARRGQDIYGIKSAVIADEYSRKHKLLQITEPQEVGEDFYAGNNEFYALSDMMGINIYIVDPKPPPSFPNITPHFKDNSKISEAPTLFLLYLNNIHFEPIIRFK